MSCVPCPCDFFKITDEFECEILSNTFQDPPRLGQLYSGIYTTATYVPEIFEGVPSMLQRDLTSWFLKVSLAFILPWIIVFIILFLVMARRGLITFDTTFMLIVVVIIIAIIAMAFVYWETTGVVTSLRTQIYDQVISNWDAKKGVIVPAIRTSYLDCPYCSSSTLGCRSTCGGVCGVCPVTSISQTTEEMLNNQTTEGMLNNRTTEEMLNNLKEIGG